MSWILIASKTTGIKAALPPKDYIYTSLLNSQIVAFIRKKNAYTAVAIRTALPPSTNTLSVIYVN